MVDSTNRATRRTVLAASTLAASSPSSVAALESSRSGHPNALTGTAQSISAGIAQGYVVAESAGHRLGVYDPTNHATHDAAAQAAIDWLEGAAPSGTVHLPEAVAQGQQFVVDNPISTSDSNATVVSIEVHTNGKSQGESTGVTTTITDGDPMFRISGDLGTHSVAPTFRCPTADLGGNDAGLVEFEKAGGLIDIGTATKVGGDAVTVRGPCFNGRITIDSLVGGSTEARGIVMETNGVDHSTPIPTDWSIRAKMVGEFERCVHLMGSNRIVLSGYYEAATGRAGIDIDGGSRTLVTPATYVVFNGRDGNSHGIYVRDSPQYVEPSYVANNGGDGIHLGPDGPSGQYGTTTTFYGNGDNSIGVESIAQSSTRTTLPYENTLTGTVDYPDTPWTYVFYPDGWQKIRTVDASDGKTLSSGGEVTLTRYGGRIGTEVAYDIYPVEDPQGTFGWRGKLVSTTATDQYNLVAVETEDGDDSGSYSADMGSVVYRRAHSTNLG